MKRFFAVFLILFAAPALAQNLSSADKDAINAQIRAYILENPEIIVEAMQVLEQREQNAKANADRDLVASMRGPLEDDGYSLIAGNPDGDVTLIEFLDYRCGYCKQAHDGVKALIASDPNIKFIIKEFPILGPESTFASRAAMATLKQGADAYLKFNDAMMRHRGNLDQPTVMRIAGEIGVDQAQLAEDIQDPQIAANIRKTYSLARRLDISGTPAFIIGDTVVRGFLPYDSLKEIVEEQRERG